MKVGDLVRKKYCDGEIPGVIVEVILDVAIVYWSHLEKTHMYYFHKLEVVNAAA